ACAPPSPAPAPETTPGATPTPTPSPTVGPTRTPTPTPTATPTPTPTALPLEISGDLRSPRLATPFPQRGAPCGVIDLLDFPVGAPNGYGFVAPWTVGSIIGGYSGLHAGEDWVSAERRSLSLGQPVESIGHGRVLYAQPRGWGIDLGAVIVRHTFADGKTILSFYGHLDPESVLVKAGDCVKRGDQLGSIGNPRGRPHLHFEIRHHLPDQPGPGYWPTDPLLAGWEEPTDYIWANRIRTAPGVKWTRPFTSANSIGLGLLADGTLAALGGENLIGIDPGDGSLRWSRPISDTRYRSVIDATGNALYLSNLFGAVLALDVHGQLIWQNDFDTSSSPELMPLPGGGVVVYADQKLIGVAASGGTLWQIDQLASPFAWTLRGEQLILTTRADEPAAYSLDRSGQLVELARIGGRPTVSGNQLFIYNSNGLYRLDVTTHTTDLLLSLDPGSFDPGDAAAMNGGLIVSHRGYIDRRLIWLNAAGTLRWDRSVAELGYQVPQLAAFGQRVYALTSSGDILLVDPIQGNAQRLFDGGFGRQLPGDPWAFVTARGQILFDARGGQIIAFDPWPVIRSINPDTEPER
ncbi:MAG TPA: PQQ-binding-like beta-propeller repeat protein, partial [Anaerolineae bacterium]